MDKAFHFQSISYAPILKAERISFKEDDKCLNVGHPSETCGFAIFVSCRTLDTPEMLKRCLTILKQQKSAYRIIKNQNLQYQLNSGVFGEQESGKVLSIFPRSKPEFITIADEFSSLTGDLKGPVVVNSQRISNVLYVQRAELIGNDIKLWSPKISEIPLLVPREYRKKQRKKAILGKYYLPVELLRSSAKGNIYKGVNLRRLAFNWCLIKQGNPVAFDDHFDRDMKDRLQWQREVIGQLQFEISTPSFIDYFEERGSAYLILGFAEGQSLGHNVRELLSGLQWKTLKGDVRIKLLGWYLQAVEIVDLIHKNGIIHRDITDSNFIVLSDNRLCIIDFELSYSTVNQKPDPPFLLGTFGYASPQQLQYHYPETNDDVYALGALLCFIVTGCQPHEFINPSLTLTKTKLLRLSESEELSALAINCLRGSRKNRPLIQGIRSIIKNHLETLITKENETFKLAV